MYAPYVALSHRWGDEHLPATTSANLESRIHQLTQTDLTQTMKDAIRITRELGYQYLWIDALCIVQDSQDDWLREAAKMSEVFSGAIVTLAAADATNHSQGMFRARSGESLRPFLVPLMDGLPYRKRIRMDGEGPTYVFPNNGLVSAGVRPKSTLDTRGWILQEQLLSPRMLYFGHGEVFWDCNTVSASESSPISTSLLDDPDPDDTWALKIVRKTLAASQNAETLRQRLADIWTQVIKNYSARHLAKQSDKLIALNGITQPLITLLGEPLIAGMWKTELWRQLIWWQARHQPNPTSQDHAAHDAFPAPTWSWLSTTNPVKYHNTLSINTTSLSKMNNGFGELEQRMRLVSVETTTLPGSTGVEGRLTISGLSFRFHLTSSDLKSDMAKRFHASKWKLNAGNWMLDTQVVLPLDVHCIIVARDVVAKMLVCLCLIPTERAGEWRRVGLCHWDGLGWQVERFAGRKPEEMKFVIV